MSITASTMAEFPDLNPNQSSPPLSSSSSPRFTMPGIKRLIITLSVVFPFLAVIPFLLKSTAIYRSPLPFTAINSLSDLLLPEPPSPPCRLHAVFLRRDFGSDTDQLASLISKEVDKRISGRNYAVSVTFDSCKRRCLSGVRREKDSPFWKCGSFDLRKKDEIVDELLREAAGSGAIYTVVVGERDEEEEVRIVVGKYRHAWVRGNVADDDAVLLVADVFVKYFVNGGTGREEFVGPRKGEFVPVGLDGSLVLSFSLLNANPNDWVYDWCG